MAMFGNTGKQTPIAAFASDPQQELVRQPIPSITTPMPGVKPRKEGFYGDLPMWKVLLGTALDNIAQQTGGQGVFTQGVRQQREFQQRQALAEQQRQAERNEWLFRAGWERANPAPRAPHYWEMNDGSLGVVGPDGKPQVVYKDPTPKINWIRADNGDGTQSLIPVGPNGPISAKGGDPASGGAGGGLAPSPSSGGFMTLDQFKAMRTVPTFRAGHPAWSTPVRVSNEAEYNQLPSGKTYIAPDGSVRTKK